MLDLIAAAALVVAGSLLTGHALARLCRSEPGVLMAPAGGFAALLIVASVAIRLPGRAATAGVAAAVVILCAAAYLLRAGLWRPPRWAIVATVLSGAAVLIPFAASGRAGILGVGTNDDLAEHLLAAWTLQGHQPSGASKIVSSGYPIGPHAIAASIAQLTGMPLELAFTGLILAIPVLLALTAGAMMPSGRSALRGLAAAAAGTCYLQAAFLSQASFKELIEGLLVVGLAAGLYVYGRERARTLGTGYAMPFAALGAGAVYAYSYPGMAWLLATVAAFAVLRFLSVGRRFARSRRPAVMVAGGTFAVLVAPEIPRMLNFARSGYNHESAGVLGNLLRPLPPLEATGIWPSVDFRFDVPLGSLSGILACAAVAAMAIALWRSLRRGDFAIPAALAATAALWGLTSGGSPYTEAKSLAILAPVFTLLIGREMLVMAGEPSRLHATRALAVAFAGLLAVGLYSDLKVLRDAPVGPSEHAAELASLRTTLGRGPALFLGTDDYAHWDLRGVAVATPPAPLYTRMVAPLRRTKARQDDRLFRPGDGVVTFNRFAGLGLAFDFDSVPTRWLDRFRFVIVPRSGYGSEPPANWRLVRVTRSYELWQRHVRTRPHQTLTEVDNPGAILDCATPAGRSLARLRGVAMVRPAPVVGNRWWWKGHVGYAGQSATMTLRLGRGRWRISLQYDSRVRVTLRALNMNAVLAPNLEPLGPYWLAGVLRVPRPQRVRFVMHFDSLPTLGGLLGASGQTRAPKPTGLIPRGRLTASGAPSEERAIPLNRACGRYVDWYRLR